MVKCKKCLIEKDINDFYLYKGVRPMANCKECIKKGRRSEEERVMARVFDIKRSKKPERIKYVTDTVRQWRLNNPEKRNAHKIVNNYFRYHKEEKPEICYRCNSVENIELHHNDYSKPREIIPLCSLCHKGYHANKISLEGIIPMLF